MPALGLHRNSTSASPHTFPESKTLKVVTVTVVAVLQQMRGRGRLLALITILAMVVVTAPVVVAPLLSYLWELLTP